MQLLPIEKWAKKYKINLRQAYRWAKSGKLPTDKRTVEVKGVPPRTTLAQVVKREKGRDY